jgi:vancomycin resistance protein VanW
MKSTNRHGISHIHILGWCVLAAVGAGILTQLIAAPPYSVEIAGFATSLKGRTASQRHNAWLAARDLDGARIRPGAVFSFNRQVKSWGQDDGYVKAPVSFDGELIRAYGGGVCQTSTTLYNVALLAGLPIVERHHHVFAAHYAAPGRDAAVAQPGIDLRFKNPYPWPIRIQASAKGDTLSIRMFGAEKPRVQSEILSQVLDSTSPARLTRVVDRPGFGSSKVFVRSPGATGCRAVTYRIFHENGREIRRERLSDDTYEAMDRVVQVNEDGQTP